MGGFHRRNMIQEKPNFRTESVKLRNSKPREEKWSGKQATRLNEGKSGSLPGQEAYYIWQKTEGGIYTLTQTIECYPPLLLQELGNCPLASQKHTDTQRTKSNKSVIRRFMLGLERTFSYVGGIWSCIHYMRSKSESEMKKWRAQRLIVLLRKLFWEEKEE